MRKLKHKTALALTTAAMLACSVAVSAPANAASSPIAACGGGSYHVVDSYDLTGHPGNGSTMLYLLYNGTTNCVVTWLTGGLSRHEENDLKIASQSCVDRFPAREPVGPLDMRPAALVCFGGSNWSERVWLGSCLTATGEGGQPPGSGRILA